MKNKMKNLKRMKNMKNKMKNVKKKMMMTVKN